MPKDTSLARVQAVQAEEADVIVTECNYDEAVMIAEKTSVENNWVLLQDTAWQGYEKIPACIMEGYFTLLSEFLAQEQELWPTHVFIQAGVGSLAASLVTFLYHCTTKPKPVIAVAEPKEAACYFNSVTIGDGRRHTVYGALPTIMAGLACGKPSMTGWKVLKNSADAFIACSDTIAEQGMRLLANPVGSDRRIISGESGAVTAGLVNEILSNKAFFPLKERLGVDKKSNILLFSTEGDTDPEMYRKIVTIRSRRGWCYDGKKTGNQ
jgi:diaminopropionate ammonia-lyase